MLGDGGVRPEHIAAVAAGAGVTLSDDVGERLTTERAALDAGLSSGAAVYGVTHGLGARSGQRVAGMSDHEFAASTVRGRAHAVGAPLPEAVVRAAMGSRLAAFAAGGSAISPGVASALAALVNAQVTPVVPSIGSIGLSDLCQFAHVGLVLIGEGEATTPEGARLDGAAALASARLDTARLAAKDGLTLCGANPLAIGAASLAAVRLQRLVDWATGLFGLSLVGFAANPSPLHPGAVGRRADPDLDRVAARLRHLVGGAATAAVQVRRLQDPVSFRAAPVSLAALSRVVRRLYDEARAELNGSGDNPVLVEDQVVPTGNFHAPMLAQACDAAAIAVAAYANSVVSRCQRFLQPTLTDLPANLTDGPPHSSGLAPVIKIAQSLVVQLHRQAAPLSFDAREGADAVEDDASNASAAALRLLDLANGFAGLLAVEAVFAAQAVDLRAGSASGLGPELTALRAQVRHLSPRLGDDRSLSSELDALTRTMAASRPATG